MSKTDLGVVVATFLPPGAYANPSMFEPDDDNTMIIPFRVSNIYGFEENYINKAKDFWEKCVLTGISPRFNENNPKDMEIVNAIREKYCSPVTSFTRESINDLPFE